jgi:hypothetical protein
MEIDLTEEELEHINYALYVTEMQMGLATFTLTGMLETQKKIKSAIEGVANE